MLQHKTTLPPHEIERINIAKFYTEYLLNLSKQHNITDKRILSENKDLFYNILFCLVIIGEATNITKMQTASKSGVFSKYGKGLNAVAILTAVGKGERPKLAENCSPAEKLIITKCWAQDPAERPTMNEVVQILQILEKSKYNTAAEAIENEFARLKEMRGAESDAPDAYDPLERVSPLNMLRV